MPLLRWLFLLGLLWCVPASAAAPQGPPPPTFEHDVRPILKVHCLHCHGEADEREGNLDLRLRRFMAAGGDSGPAIEPGKPRDSLLYQRVAAGEMPPGDKRLSAKELATIERWIAAGAPTLRSEPSKWTPELAFTEEERAFWSFQPIGHPQPPKVSGQLGKNKSAVRTPIDAFVLARLEAKGLGFSPEAPRSALIRRAYFDLLGLPPSPAEVDAFVNDQAADAYERLIDRLLERPEYGERWGRHWLDIAGYADSDGYTPQDPLREYAYKYRDYVIGALNADKPLDAFIREQLAGDELIGGLLKQRTPENIEKLVATGFLRMAPDGTGVGSVDQNVARNQVVADTLKIVSSSLLGLTVGCAECHDHKFDPILQEDYYRLRAVFEPALDWKNWRAPRTRMISLMSTADRQRSLELEAEAKKVDAARLKLADEFIATTFEDELLKLPKEQHAPLRAAFFAPLAKRTPAQKKLLKEQPSLNITIGSLYLFDRPRENALYRAKAKRTQRVKQLVTGVAIQTIASAPVAQRAALHALRTANPAKFTPAQQALAKAYPVVLVSADTLAKVDAAAAKEIAALDQEVAKCESEISTRALSKLAEQAAEIRSRKPKEDYVSALTEAIGKVPTTYLFYRGQFTQPKQAVAPGEPRILARVRPTDIPVKDAHLPSTGRRLALAKQLTDAEHPLVSRVLANRIWLLHFGRGIVNTPADFGKLGERPTHPELLDWLARELTGGGWRLKRMHKMIMTSAVYRQASARRPELEAVDPDNRLLGRMNVRRAEAEAIRDSILAVSGKLNLKQFGPPVPVMPDNVGQVVIGIDTRDSAGRPSGKEVSLGDEVFRRSIYVQVRRSMPLGMLETFDAPTMTSACNCESRSNSTVAPQSLILMNSEFLLEQSRLFAARLMREAAGPP
ncbi:MAG TPA: PSD1 and planctomycete cytochrome C domain-containing protein, partial [Pirellulales bacterium]